MNKKRRILTLAAVCTAIVLALTFCNRCSKNQSQGEAVTAADSIETMADPFDIEPIATDEPTDAEPVVAEKSTTKAKKKKKPIQGEWVIENDVTKVKDIAFEEIADDIIVKPILTDEPLGDIFSISGNSNDFICDGNRHSTFYHIKDGKFVEKLHAVGRGPGEYSNQILGCSYLPDEGLFYGCDENKRCIMCYKTMPFRFVSNIDILLLSQSNHLEDMIVLGRDHILISLYQPITDWGLQVDNSYDVYEVNGNTIKKIISSKVAYFHGGMFMRSGDDVLMSIREEKSMLYRFVDGQVEKVATIDYGDMQFGKDKIVKTKGEVNNQKCTIITVNDNVSGCLFAQLSDSVMTYWVCPKLKNKVCRYLTIATRDKVQNYKVHIGGLNKNKDVLPDMVDNGVYTMLIQGDWEEKINLDEKLSPVGKRIIEAMKGNDYDPVIVQFRLKNKYLTSD